VSLPASVANCLPHPHHPYFLNQRKHRRVGAALRPLFLVFAPRNIVSFLHSHSCTSAVEPPTNRRGLILLFQSALPFSLTLAKFHEAYVIAVHAWVKQWHCSDLLEWRPPHLPAAVRDGRLAASSRGREQSRPTDSRPLPAGGVSWCCHLFSPPRGSSAAGAGPRWVGGTRTMPSGEIWGDNGPAAGALIGLTQSQLPPPDHHFSSREHPYGLYRLLRNYLRYHHPIIFSRESPPAACISSAVQTPVSTTPTR
jgi:hypothetical protein